MVIAHLLVSDGGTAGRRAFTTRFAPDRRDWLIAVVVALLAGVAFGWMNAHIDKRLYVRPIGNDVWFEADLPLVRETLISVTSSQGRNASHPLYPLFGTVPMAALNVAGIRDEAALPLWIGAVAALWAAGLWFCLRLSTPSAIDALAFTALALTSASALFWLTLPETFSAGSIALIGVMLLASLPDPVRAGWYTLSMVLLAGTTITNAAVGMIAAAIRYGVRNGIQIASAGFAAMLVLWAIVKLAFPTLPFFLEYDWHPFILRADSGGPLAILRTILVHSIVMPQIQLGSDPQWGAIMSIQGSPVGSGGPLSAVAAGCWIALLAIGLVVTASRVRDHDFERVLAGALLFQVGLHILFGEQTFLYAMHFAPLLVLVASRGTLSRARPYVLVLATVVALTGCLANAAQFRFANTFLQHERIVSR